MAQFEISLKVPGREELSLFLETDDSGQIQNSKLRGIGGPSFLNFISEWRIKLQGSLDALELPEENHTGALMLREALLKAKGQWHYPYDEEELCHCRAVPVQKVDAAILVGAHTPEKVSRMTSASTSCGTCRPDVEAILKHRLVSK